MPPPQGLVKKLEKTGDLVKAPSRKGDSSQLAVLGGGGVALALLLGGGYYLFGSKTTAVSVGDTATLKRVFYSGEPWLIECSTSRSATVVREAEGELKAGVRTAVLNCHEKLPSGLSTLQRFKLSAWPKGPTVLMAANLEKPQVAPPAAAASGAALAKWANARAAPRVVAPSSGKQFEQNCLRKKWCVLVFVAGPRLNDGDKKALTQLAREHRGVRFVTVDAAKHTLSLDLPGGVPPPKVGVVSGQTLVLLKDLGATGAAGGEDDEGGGAARASAAVLLESGLGDAAATGKRLAEALAAADDFPAGLTRLTKRPSLKSRTPPPTPPRAQTYERKRRRRSRRRARTPTPSSRRSASASPKRRGSARSSAAPRWRRRRRRRATSSRRSPRRTISWATATTRTRRTEMWRRWSSTRIEQRFPTHTARSPHS